MYISANVLEYEVIDNRTILKIFLYKKGIFSALDGIRNDNFLANSIGIAVNFGKAKDTNKDGVPDKLDKCLNTPAGIKVTQDGCPVDGDGAGVADIDDKCPTVFGIKENKGCPAVKEETLKVFTQALSGITFETGKDVIRPTSFAILNNVVSIINNNPEYNLEINGHTDSVGDDAKNLDLSQRRANTVKKYITDKGIAAVRMTAKGYGETLPVADNNTPAARTKNRRVEFKVVF